MWQKVIYKWVHSLLKIYWGETYRRYKDKYKLPNSFKFNGSNILLYGNGNLIVGEKSYIGRFSQLQLCEGYKIIIGNNCRIASNVKMYTGTNLADQDFSQLKIRKKYGDIIVKDNVWIGANVFIVPGVSIGENCVVGANSVVTKDIPSHSICGGVPAVVLKKKHHV